MIISMTTEARIISLMACGAKLYVYRWMEGSWADPVFGTSRITLEHNGVELRLTEDAPLWFEYFYSVRCDDTYLRNKHGRDYAGRTLARKIIQRDDVRSEYAGYRGDYDKTWRELYVHVSTPAPRVISEWWNAELQNQYSNDTPW